MTLSYFAEFALLWHWPSGFVSRLHPPAGEIDQCKISWPVMTSNLQFITMTITNHDSIITITIIITTTIIIIISIIIIAIIITTTTTPSSSSSSSSLSLRRVVYRELKQTRTATASRGTRTRLFLYFWHLCNSAYSYLSSNLFRFCKSSTASWSLIME